MTVILAADASRRLAAVPSPIEWDVSFARVDPTTWDVTVHLAAERDPYTSTPDPVIARGGTEAAGDAHRFNIWGAESFTSFGGDDTMLAVARQIIDEVTR